MPDLTTLIGGIDFGEGPRWHDGRLWYSDFYQHAVFTVDLQGRREQVVEVPNQPSGLGWLPDGDLLVVSMLDHRVLRLTDRGLLTHGDLSAIATGPANDMVVDGLGNAYVGNFGSADASSEGGVPTATLALVRPEGMVAPVASGMRFPNGSVVTPDGATLIVAESAAARFTAFDIARDGTLDRRRIWAAVPGYSPDGCTLDAAGGLWFADARGQRVARVLEGGEVTGTIDTGAGTWACMLGGDDGRTLFITTGPGPAEEDCAGKADGAILMTRVEFPHAGWP